MKRARARLSWSLIGLAAVAVGCGDPRSEGPRVTPAPVADLAQLLGPWQREPFAVDAAIVGAADQRCRAELRRLIADRAVKLVLVEARGGGHISLLYAGPDREGQCELRVRRDGAFQPIGGGGGEGPGFVVLEPHNLEIRSGTVRGAHGVEDGMTSVSGLAGNGLAGVRVILPNGETIRAAVGGGWFSAWWPGENHQFRVVGVDHAGVVVAEARQ